MFGQNTGKTDKMKKKVKNNYIDNKKFYDTIVDYKKRVKQALLENKPKPEIPPYAAQCIIKIAEQMATRYHSFSRYSYNDEMIGDSILNCTKYFDSFDETKWNNPHAYFTKICHQSNVLRIKTEQKSQFVKYKSFTHDVLGIGDPNDIISHENGGENTEIYDNILKYIDDYEKKDAERKLKRKEKLAEKKMKDSLERFYRDDEDKE